MVLPAGLAAALVAWVVLGHAARVRAEAVGAIAVSRLHASQLAFRDASGGFAATLDSLTSPCPSGEGPWLDAVTLRRLAEAGYELVLRAHEGARVHGSDCQGRPLVDDYYVGVQPAGGRVAPQRAYGSTGAGRVFVFVDGIAPTESDMAPGGLATPLEDMATFRIP